MDDFNSLVKQILEYRTIGLNNTQIVEKLGLTGETDEPLDPTYIDSLVASYRRNVFHNLSKNDRNTECVIKFTHEGPNATDNNFPFKTDISFTEVASAIIGNRPITISIKVKNSDVDLQFVVSVLYAERWTQSNGYDRIAMLLSNDNISAAKAHGLINFYDTYNYSAITDPHFEYQWLGMSEAGEFKLFTNYEAIGDWEPNSEPSSGGGVVVK